MNWLVMPHRWIIALGRHRPRSMMIYSLALSLLFVFPVSVPWRCERWKDSPLTIRSENGIWNADARKSGEYTRLVVSGPKTETPWDNAIQLEEGSRLTGGLLTDDGKLLVMIQDPVSGYADSPILRIFGPRGLYDTVWRHELCLVPFPAWLSCNPRGNISPKYTWIDSVSLDTERLLIHTSGLFDYELNLKSYDLRASRLSGRCLCRWCIALLVLSFPISALISIGYRLNSQLRERLRQRAITSGHCPTCGYMLFGLVSNRCPECGTAVHTLGVPSDCISKK